MSGQHATAVALRRPRVRTFARALSDGACTTVHVAAYPQRTTRVRLELMGRPLPLASWCEQSEVENAIVGGFFLRQGDGTPLGELWRRGERVESVPFDDPWAATRSCVAIESGRIRLAPRDDLPERPTQDQIDDVEGRITRTDVLLAATVLVGAATGYAGIALVNWNRTSGAKVGIAPTVGGFQAGITGRF